MLRLLGLIRGFCRRDDKSTNDSVRLRLDRCTSVDLTWTRIRRPIFPGFLLLSICRNGAPSRAILAELATPFAIPDILICDITPCCYLAETSERTTCLTQ